MSKQFSLTFFLILVSFALSAKLKQYNQQEQLKAPKSCQIDLTCGKGYFCKEGICEKLPEGTPKHQIQRRFRKSIRENYMKAKKQLELQKQALDKNLGAKLQKLGYDYSKMNPEIIATQQDIKNTVPTGQQPDVNVQPQQQKTQ